MATFLANLIRNTQGSLATSEQDFFSDDNGNTHESSINQLAAARVVSGTTSSTYNPAGKVTRAQMATFVVRTVEFRLGRELSVSQDHFTDDDGNPHERNINKAADAGIGHGTGPGMFSPSRTVPREHMASFVARALDVVAGATDASPPSRPTMGCQPPGGLHLYEWVSNPDRVTAPAKKFSGATAEVCAGFYNTYAVASDGVLWGWGYNYRGQLGRPRDPDRPLFRDPVVIPGVSGVEELACMVDNVGIVRADGTVWVWGHNESCQLTDAVRCGDVLDQSHIPVRVGGIDDATRIWAGSEEFYVARSDGTMWRWGRRTSFHNGDFHEEKIRRPQLLRGLRNIIDMGVAVGSSLALLPDGSVWGWGLNQNGILGPGEHLDYHGTPIRIRGLGAARALAVGDHHALVALRDGTVWTWGSNFGGTYGDGTYAATDRDWGPTPRRVPGLAGIFRLAAGEEMSAALNGRGELWQWGGDQTGQRKQSLRPSRVTLASVVVIDAAGHNYVGVTR